MQFGQLAFEGHDLFDPLNHIRDESKNQQGSAQGGSDIKETLTRV